MKCKQIENKSEFNYLCQTLFGSIRINIDISILLNLSHYVLVAQICTPCYIMSTYIILCRYKLIIIVRNKRLITGEKIE